MKKIITDMDEWIKEVGDLAGKIHADVNQKYDNQPYKVHLDMVVDNAIRYINYLPDDCHKIVIFAAYFHDTIEDARLSYNDVMAYAKKMGLDKSQALLAAEIVYACTNEKGRTRADRENDAYFETLRETLYAPFVKTCDRLANMTYSKESGSSMFKKYATELPEFINRMTYDMNPIQILPEQMLAELYKITLL